MMDTKTIPTFKKPTTLADSVEDFIYNYIIQNELRPGDHLPSEDDFAVKLGVSRNIVREALSRMKSYGYVTSRRRGGLVIQAVNVSKDLHKILVPQLMDRQTLANILELRLLLEYGIVQSLFDNICQEDIDELQEIVDGDETDALGFSKIDTEIMFHGRIFQITGNTTLEGLQGSLLPVYRYVRSNEEQFQQFNDKLSSEGQKANHRDILEALKSGDPSKYEDVIHRHLYPYQEFVRSVRGGR